MDTMMYASVAVLPWSIAKSRSCPVRPEIEAFPFNLSILKRS